MPSGFRVWNTSSKRTMLEGEGSRETAWKAAWSDVRFIPLAHVFRSFIIWLGNSAELVLNTSHRSGTEILLSLGWGQTSQKSLDSSYLFHFCSPVFVSVVVFSPQSHNWSDHSFVGFFRGACLLTLALLWFISEWGGWGYLLAASSLHVPLCYQKSSRQISFTIQPQHCSSFSMQTYRLWWTGYFKVFGE